MVPDGFRSCRINSVGRSEDVPCRAVTNSKVDVGDGDDRGIGTLSGVEPLSPSSYQVPIVLPVSCALEPVRLRSRNQRRRGRRS